MLKAIDRPHAAKVELYDELAAQLRGLVETESDEIANMANCAALLFHSLPDLNWAGFYLLRGDELVLGPFQGRPACVRIPLGRGVCGTAAIQRRVLRVPDVCAFADHIACDSASRAEIVLPLMTADARLLGVLDLDSPTLDRFDQSDETGLHALAAIMVTKLS
ncbi:MAG TPA: GAF domain-containing protein [Chthoniobacterales bacterium]|nr:GAF domain-containing protein [Chthoniobacterales bacterium]